MKKLILAVALLAATMGVASAASVISDGGYRGADPGPWGNTIFVRGGFNGWGAVDAMSYDGVSATYTAVLNIDAGDWEFKIADEGWGNPDFGPTGDQNIVLGVASDIGTAIGANFSLSIVDSGNYLFTLSDLSPDLTSGQLVVAQVVPVPAAGLLLLSALGGLGFLRRRS